MLRYVSNLESEEQLVKEAAARSKLLETQKAEHAAQKAAAEAAIQERRDAIAALAGCTDDVWQLWQLAVELAVKHLPIGAAYVAAVADITAGDPAAFLRDTAPVEAGPPADAAETEDAAKEEEEGEAADETATSSAAAASTAAPAAIKQMYSKQHLEYIASSQNQAWIGTGGMRLLRPVSAVPAEGEDEEAAAAAAAAAAASLAPTLKMLDDNRSSLHIPNVLYEPSTVFLK
ncbi:hypothetical protein WJX84_002196, partial [Apatococcus fuscideae]